MSTFNINEKKSINNNLNWYVANSLNFHLKTGSMDQFLCWFHQKNVDSNLNHNNVNLTPSSLTILTKKPINTLVMTIVGPFFPLKKTFSFGFETSKSLSILKCGLGIMSNCIVALKRNQPK